MGADVERLVGRGLLSHPSDGVCLVRAVRVAGEPHDFVVEHANRAADDVMGGGVVGRAVRDMFARDGADLAAWFTHVLADGGPGIRRWHAHLPGTPMHARWYETFATGAGDERVVVHIRDVTEETRLREDLERDALHDPLTGLPNRRWFTRRLRQALDRLDEGAGLLGLLFIDVDDFKLVNDTLGHAAGDELLRRCADRIGAAVRPTDSVARFGGDELVVLCEELPDVASAREVADRVHTLARGTYALEVSQVPVTVSIGLAVTDRPGPARRLLSEADTALYEAKRRGRNRVQVYDAGLGQAVTDRLRIHDALSRALDDGELELHFQPEYELATGRLAAAEALLRWHQPHTGLQAPGDFLPVAEQTGLMSRIGEWVLHTACREARRWVGLAAQAPTVNVNLSQQELLHPGLIDTLESALGTSGLDPQHLEVEITESHAADDPDRVTAVLDRIRALGPTIALDDFGTGYSSLLWLRRFPVTTVKLDRAFVSRLTTGTADYAIVEATIALAHTLGLRVVAEGIETTLQRRLLTDLGADLGQGYALARPMPAAQLRELIRAGTALPARAAAD